MFFLIYRIETSHQYQEMNIPGLGTEFLGTEPYPKQFFSGTVPKAEFHDPKREKPKKFGTQNRKCVPKMK